MQQLAFTSAGFIGTPFVEGALQPFLPANISANTIGRYAVRVGTVLALSWGVKQFVGSSEGKAVLLGGSAYVVTTALADLGWLPGTGGANGVARYVPQANQLRRYVPQANQVPAAAPRRGMGEYVRSAARPFSAMGRGGKPAINQTPVTRRLFPYGG